jgi:cytochrome c biogenesis protein CcmG/thiol:disulfide interchange protein DsbE
VTEEPKTSETEAIGAEAAAPKKSVAVRWLVLTPLALLMVVAGVSFAQLTGPRPQPATFTSPKRPAPNFDVATLDGGRVKLSDFKGRPVLVNVWGSYCAPCKLEHPLLMKMAAQGVEILGVLYEDREPQEARNILAKQGNPFTKVGIDLDGDLGIAFGISGVPESFLIDANGEIVKTKRNYFTEDDLPEFIAAYKAEVAKAAKAS